MFSTCSDKPANKNICIYGNVYMFSTFSDKPADRNIYMFPTFSDKHVNISIYANIFICRFV